MNPPTTPSDAGSSVQTEPLLPCPFCGGKASALRQFDTDQWAACCDVCEARNGDPANYKGFTYQEAAIAAWNCRAPVSSSVQTEPGKPERYTLHLQSPDFIHSSTLSLDERAIAEFFSLADAKGIVAALNAHNEVKNELADALQQRNDIEIIAQAQQQKLAALEARCRELEGLLAARYGIVTRNFGPPVETQEAGK